MNEKFANKFSFNYQPQIDVSTSFPHIDTFSIGLLITFENSTDSFMWKDEIFIESN